MRLTSAQLSRYPRVFRHMTGRTVAEFDVLVQDLLPIFTARDHARLRRPTRQRASAGGTPCALTPREPFVLTGIWLRQYPMHEGLGLLFDVTQPTVGRLLQRRLPLLEAADRATRRVPDPGMRHRRTLDALLADTPELAVIIDPFEQPGQRPQDRRAVDTDYSGKKKQHTHKTQIAVDETTGRVVDVSATVRGPIAALTRLPPAGLLERLPPGGGSLGDVADVGMAGLHPQGVGAPPRRKPRGNLRPPDDVADHRAFARRRITVAHRIGRLRCVQALTQRDRHHRQHTGRGCAVAGLVNRCLGRTRR